MLRPRTLYQKVSVTFLVLVFLVGGLQYLALIYYWTLGTEESTQRLHWEQASDYAHFLREELRQGAHSTALQEKASLLQQLNPAVDIFFVHEDGAVLPLGITIDALAQQRIDVAPIRAFLGASAPEIPLYGEQPLAKGGRSIFSAAPAMLGDARGYLYVILHGHRVGYFNRAMTEYHSILGSLWITAVLIILAAAIGLLVFQLVTRRFRAVTNSVHAFALGDLNRRVPVPADDEIGRLGREFNAMADTIVENIKKLEHTDALRRELVQNVSHDLAGPLSAIKGYLDYLSRGNQLDATKREKFLEAAQKNVYILLRLVKQLFELSKLEAKEIEPCFESFSISELVTQDLLVSFGGPAQKRGIRLSADVPDDLPFVLGDPALIERVLANLLENALRYCREGDTVEVRLAEEHDKVKVELRDSGPGIPAEALPRLFERFFRVESERTKAKGGSGLGLAIVKSIIDAHHQTISVQSTVGQGTVFSFHLPAATNVPIL